MKIYIAGSITNNPNYKEDFASAERRVMEMGYVPLNPCKNEGFTYKEYIDMGLNELSKCDAILMLNGWMKSAGANLEHQYALTIGMTVYFDFIHEIKTSNDLLLRK